MRIAVVSTVYRPTPPRGYGGIERVVATLVDELVRQGHEVVLFAGAGSRSRAEMVTVELGRAGQGRTGVRRASELLSEEPLYEAVSRRLGSRPVDVVHDWSLQNLFVLRHPEKFPFVISTSVPRVRGHARPNLVACSRAHAATCGERTRHVHYGLDLERWAHGGPKQDHLLHVAKIARYKGQHLAVRAARAAGVPLRLAGNVEDRVYHYLRVLPALWRSPLVSYVGELDGTNPELMVARALVQTPRWFEAFPLVVLEALASGTPVIAFRNGGIPEQIRDGVTGFLCDDEAGLAEAMRRVKELDPRACRADAEERFAAARMARDYLALYREVLDGASW